MTKRKRFTISKSLTQGLSDTINVATNNAGNLRYEVVPIHRLELDPNNPRELALSREDLPQGPSKSDPDYKRKQLEFEELVGLANTIKENGVINPVVAYKHTENYRLVAGERRLLSSIIADKQDIHARILNEKPTGMNLRVLQWVENNERKNLYLDERIKNISAIIAELEKEFPTKAITVSWLSKIIGFSKTVATYYLGIINGPKDVIDVVNARKILALDKAYMLAMIKNVDTRQHAIQACVDGASKQKLKAIIDASKRLPAKDMKDQTKAKSINLGSTSSSRVLRRIVQAVISDPIFQEKKAFFKSVDWSDPNHAKKAFKELISILETEE